MDHEAAPTALQLTEAAVVGRALIATVDRLDILSALAPDDISDPVLRRVLDAVGDLHSAGQPVDYPAVARHVEQTHGSLAVINGAQTLVDLGNAGRNTPAGAALASCHAIATAAFARRTEQVLTRYTSGQLSVEDVETHFAGKPSATAGSSGMVTAADAVRMGLQEADDLEHGRITYTPTHLTGINKVLNGGMRGGRLYVVAGRPGTGKTIIATETLLAAAAAGFPSLMFSLEMSNLELGARFALIQSGRVDKTRMDTGTLTQADWEHLTTAEGQISKLPLYLTDDSSMTVEQIVASTRLAVARHGIKLVVVDYLGLLTSSRRFNNRTEEVSFISRTLKVLAKTYDIAVIALHQLNRNPEGRADHRPSIGDLRESGAIEQDADVVGLLYRPGLHDPQEDQARMEILFPKNRQGVAPATVDVVFLGHKSQIRDAAPSHYDSHTAPPVPAGSPAF